MKVCMDYRTHQTHVSRHEFRLQAGDTQTHSLMSIPPHTEGWNLLTHDVDQHTLGIIGTGQTHRSPRHTHTHTHTHTERGTSTHQRDRHTYTHRHIHIERERFQCVSEGTYHAPKSSQVDTYSNTSAAPCSRSHDTLEETRSPDCPTTAIRLIGVCVCVCVCVCFHFVNLLSFSQSQCLCSCVCVFVAPIRDEVGHKVVKQGGGGFRSGL